MIESTEFENLCKKRLKKFTDLINISYYDGVIEFGYEKEQLHGSHEYAEDDKFKFIKQPKDKSVSIKSKYCLSAFIKYTKCYKLSTITKIYLSNKHPLIIEYDINPGLGTLQIFVQQCNNVK